MANHTRRKRQIESDDEEAGQEPSRVEEEENNEPRHRGSNAQARNNATRRPRTTDVGSRGDDSGNRNDEDEDSIIDVENFSNQPLGKPDLIKLRGIASDWKQMEETARKGWGVIGDVASAYADAAEDDAAEKGLAELDIIMKDLIDISAEMLWHEQSLEELHQMIARNENIVDAMDRYEAGVESRKSEYVKKTTRQKYGKRDEYVAFRQAIFEAQDKPFPPINDLIPKEDGDDSDDDDLEVGGMRPNYTCPLTLVTLVNPVTSRVCGHSFSEDAIRQTFRTPTAEVKCPASGCNKRFKLSDLKPNKELAKKVKAWEKRAKRVADDIDAEEIIE